MSDLKVDVQLFFQRLCWTNDARDQHVNAPVLAKIDVNEFVAAYLALHPNDQRVVMLALKGRYEGGQLEGELEDEKPWITAVRRELVARMPGLSAISKYRLQKQIEWYLKAIGT
ncbi:hypothetical protein JQ617_38310 [Bradyrhizobium sp. KB893862 SZCCT0404]|uniref:hypothetical protein n=1 Tax=Bradyrhizobium sp. KB893862 SZCCT0404 TaxID=2807672 RepID=UPI001BAA77CA|nr:hypothetical protein [Bradyrhizobium sp. KB893862 SZCCT0404]MBR1179874.1 hypothetical protein [Bradyrhizobium sp. KB893862 SZCCT0404]